MRIIVSDSSALIDVRKGNLLESFLRLPYELVIPDVLLESELLSFSKGELALIREHMVIATLGAEGVERAGEIVTITPALSLIDGFALAVAEEHPGCILLAGDRRMREQADKRNIECRGVLWVVEELAKATLANAKTLHKALEIWSADPFVRLPREKLEEMLSRFARQRSPQ